MSQLIVRKLDEGVKERLKVRAKRNGRTLEAEARAILETAAAEEALPILRSEETGARGFEDSAPTEENHSRGPEAESRLGGSAAPKQRRSRKTGKGLGTLMHERFKKTGFTDEEYAEFERHIAELRAEPLKPVEFDR